MSRNLPPLPPGAQLDDDASLPALPSGAVLDKPQVEAPLQRSIVASQTKDPDQHAKVVALANRAGLPAAYVERNFDEVQKRVGIADTDAGAIARNTPHLAQFLTDPDNAAVAKDDHPALSKIEQLLDLGRSFVSSAIAGTGESLSGVARLNDIAARSIDRGLGIGGGPAIPWWLNPSEILRRPGQQLQGAGKGIEVPAERQGFGTEVAGSLGGLVPAIAGEIVAGPEAVAGLFLGQGAEAMGQRAQQANIPTPGLVEAGTITNLFNRPILQNPDGSYSTTSSTSFEEDGKEVIIPTVVDGKRLTNGMEPNITPDMTEQQKQAAWREWAKPAIDYYHKTGQHLGKFDNPDNADAYAQALHEEQERRIEKNPLKEDLGVIGGAAIAGLAGEFGIEKLLERVPPSIRNGFLRRLADVTLSGGYQAGLQAAMGLANNVATKLAIDPNQPLTQDLVNQALVGGATGFVARGILGVAVPDLAHKLNQIHQAQQSQSLFEELGRTVHDSKTFQRLPEGLQKFVLGATKDGPIENVYVPVDDIQTYAQSQNVDPAEFAEAMTPGGAEKFKQASEHGGDIAVPLADYATRIAATPAAAHFNEAVRLGDPEAMNAREARAFQNEIERSAATSPRESEIDKSANAIREDIVGQMTGLGFMPSAVDAYARLYGAAFRTLGQRAGMDPMAIYEGYKLKILRPLPEVLAKLPESDTRLDTLIDRLRAGGAPTQDEMFGKPLLDFIREKGGVKDEGGELASREIDKERKPFQKAVINTEGLPIDKAREAAAEAGYLSKQSSISDFLDAIDKEARGEPVYAQGQENPQAIEQSIVLEQLASYLKSRDIDVRTASNDEIKKALKDAAAAPANDIDARTGQVLDQSAFHGTPHMFDKFDLRKIGTGEGMQAYGWGLYFAGNKAVADFYRDNLSIGGEGTRAQMRSIEKDIADIEKHSASLVDRLGPDDPVVQSELANNEKAIERLKARLETMKGQAGRTYSVEIPEDHEFLDWNERVKDQPEAVRGALEPVLKPLRALGIDVDGWTGRHLYQELARMRGRADIYGDEGNQEAASRELGALGIPGIKYLDAQSRGEGQGTSNYVLFDDRLVDIKSYEQKFDLEKRGDIVFGPDRKFSIRLLEKADLSTFLHETGHFYLEVFGDIVQSLKETPESLTESQRQMVDDYGTLLKELGVESRDAIGRDQHEQFARSFEAYLREGKAPSPEMRSLFQRFKSWLTNIYRSLKQLNVNLSPEVTGIFDRMLASDGQIEQAQQDAGIRAMIEDQGQAERLGLSPEEFRAYGETVRKARDLAKEDLFDDYLEEYNDRQTDWYARRRMEVRDEVAQDVHGQRDYIALSFLKDGTLPDGSPLPEGVQGAKLDAAALEERYGKYKDSSVMKRLRELDLYRRDGGVDPDQAAQLFGYSSGDEMVQAVLKLRPMDTLIEAETTDRMRQQYGDMLTDGTAAEKARDAVLSDGRAKVIEREMKALAAKVRDTAPFRALGKAEERKQVKATRDAGMDNLKRFVPSQALARDIAEGRIAAMKVRDVKASAYYAAARREGNLAIEAVNRGDFEKALTHKQQELVSVEMYRAARNVAEEVTKARDYMLGFDKPAKRERIGKAGGDYLDQIDKLLARFDFSKKTLKDIDKMKSLADFIKSEADQGHELDIPAELQNEAGRKNYREMTVEELRGVRDAVKSIEHWANFKNKLLRNQAKRELDQLGADGVASIDGNSRGPRKTSLEMRLPGSQKGRSVESFFLSHLPLGSILREMDGFKDGGFLFENIMRPIDDAGNAEAVRLEKATTDVLGLYRGAYKGEESSLWQSQYIPEIKDSLTKWGRLMVALNWGNEGNRQRVQSGFGWNEGQVQAILNSLDKRDWDFVQGVWDHINSYWGEIAAKQKRVTGVEPEKVEAAPVQTKFGEYAGGYFPIVYEGRLSARAAGNTEASFAKLIEQSSYTKASTARGHTEARMKNVTMPLRLDPGVITEHLQQVIHDLTHHEMLIDVGRLLGRKDIQDAIYRNYGDVAYQELKTHIRDIALGSTPAPSWYRTFAAIRSNAVAARLGWNTVTALVHIPNITSGMVRVGPKWVIKGVIDSLSSAKGAEHSAQWIAEQSDMMRLRWKNRMVELAEFRDEIGLNRGKLSTEVRDAAAKIGIDSDTAAHFRDSYLYAIHRILQFAEIPTWVGAYEKAVNAGRDPSDARSMADRAILDAIGGGQMKDRAAVQKNAIGKIFTTFMTYGLSMHRLGREVALKDEAGLRKAMDATLLILLPTAFITGVHYYTRPHKKDETLATEYRDELIDHSLGMFVGARELQGFTRSPDYSGPAAFGSFGTARRFGYAAKRAVTVEDENKAAKARKAALKAGNELGGELFGYPAYQVDKTVEGTLDIYEGKTRNPSAILFGPPKKN